MSNTVVETKLNKPKLRFSNFNENYTDYYLSNVASLLRGKNISRDDVKNDGKNECIRYGELYTAYKEIIDTVQSKTNCALDNSVVSKVNDVLIPASGETSIDISKASCVRKDNVIIGGDINIIRLKDKFCGEYFAYYLSNKQKIAIARVAQGHSVVHLYGDQLKKIRIHIPSLQEQQKIADFLMSVDNWIGNLKAQKESLEKYKKGMMQKIFSREIRFKDDNGNDFPDWEIRKLEQIGQIVGGGTPDTTNNAYWNGDIEWFTPSEIKQRYTVTSARKITLLGLQNSSASILPHGSILVTSRATIGQISIAVKECTTNQGFQSIIVNQQNNNNLFIYYWLLHNKKELIRKANGSTFLEISGKDVKKIKGIFPSLQEQQKIADFLSSIDSQIELKQKQIENAQQWKKGLMQEMFV